MIHCGLILIYSKILCSESQPIDFETNNLLVVRVGDGNSNLSDKAASVFMDE